MSSTSPEPPMPAPAALQAPKSDSVMGILNKLSLKDILIILGTMGFLGTGAGATGANLFSPDNAALDRQQEQLDQVSKDVKAQGEQITQMVNAHQLHVASQGHPSTLQRIAKLGESMDRLNETLRDRELADREDWRSMVQTLARIESRMHTVEIQMGKLDP